MKKNKTEIMKIARSILLAFLCTSSLLSCQSLYEDLEPCRIDRKLKFVSHYNMLDVDAFNKTVSSVRVVAFNTSGIAIWEHSESGEALKEADYAIDLTETGCPTGTLTFVAWCGLDNKHLGAQEESFDVPDVEIGKTRIEDLQCTLKRAHEDVTGIAYSNEDLYPLYHGILHDVTLEEYQNITTNIEEIYTIELMKDTNGVRVILQNLSGEDLDPNSFSYTIEETNGLMHYDNSLADDEIISYRHWRRQGGKADVETDTKATTNVQVAIGDLTVARLMKDRKSYLTIRHDESDKTIARIPLTDYALLVKDRYTKDMDDQEYLDRQDQYALTFFIDKNHNWISAVIYINSWRVVLDDIEFN